VSGAEGGRCWLSCAASRKGGGRSASPSTPTISTTCTCGVGLSLVACHLRPLRRPRWEASVGCGSTLAAEAERRQSGRLQPRPTVVGLHSLPPTAITSSSSLKEGPRSILPKMLALSQLIAPLTLILNLLGPPPALELSRPSRNSAPVDLDPLFNARAAIFSPLPGDADSFDGRGRSYPADAGCLPQGTWWDDGIEVRPRALQAHASPGRAAAEELARLTISRHTV